MDIYLVTAGAKSTEGDQILGNVSRLSESGSKKKFHFQVRLESLKFSSPSRTHRGSTGPRQVPEVSGPSLESGMDLAESK